MSFYDAIRVGASGAADFEIERSLRFNRPDSTYLTKSLGSTSNRRTFTYSFWVKRTVQNSEQCLIYNGHPSSTPYGEIRFEYQGSNIHELNWYSYDGSHQFQFRTNRKFRDPSAWYHIVLALDTTQSTQSNRAKIYVNGIQETSFKTETYPSQNTDTGYNVSGNTHSIGGFRNTSNSFDGYVAEFNFIDGQQLTPSSFAETNSDTGQWVPIDTSGLTFGTNGFRLKFADNSGTTATTLGKDSSGNGNNFTPNNFSVAAGVGNDSLEDTPTNNFATLNPLALRATGADILNGNLDYKSDSNYSIAAGNFSLKTGKWYWEVTITAAMSGSNGQINGIVRGTNPNGNSYVSYDTNGNVFGIGYVYNGSIQGTSPDGSTNSASGGSGLASFTNNDVLGFASDIANGTLAIYKNGSLQTTITSLNSHDWFPAVSGYGTTSTCSLNFGQRAFAHTPPTGHLALNSQNLSDPTILLPNKHFDTVLYTGDGNATGSQSNVLEFQPDWLWTKSRNAAYNHMLYDAVRGAGNSKGLNLGGGASPGAGGEGTSADNAVYGYLNSFDANGFSYTKGSAGTTYFNQSGINYVNWIWNAGDTDSATYTVKVVSDSGNKYRFNDFGTSAVTLDLAEGGTYTFDGSDSSMSGHPFVLGTAANGSVYSTGVTYQLDGASVTYSAYTSGYSSATTRKLIITVPASAPQLYYWCSIHSGMGGAINTNSTLGSSNFDGSLQATVKANTTAGFSIGTYTAQSSGSATVGHGLGVAPDVVITKSRTVTSNWYSYHQAIGQDGWIFLNDHAAATTGNSAVWNPAPTSSVFTYGSGLVNFGDVVFYAFSEVAGYSKFGSYTGNGNADGPFIFTGFRPAWIMIKRTNSSEGWQIFDNKRSPINEIGDVIEANTNAAAVTSIPNWLDFLSNGIKLRAHYTNGNGSGSTYIYLAFAESPFKNSRAR